MTCWQNWDWMAAEIFAITGVNNMFKYFKIKKSFKIVLFHSITVFLICLIQSESTWKIKTACGFGMTWRCINNELFLLTRRVGVYWQKCTKFITMSLILWSTILLVGAGLGSEMFSSVDRFDVILSSGVYVWTSCLAWRITVDVVEWLDGVFEPVKQKWAALKLQRWPRRRKRGEKSALCWVVRWIISKHPTLIHPHRFITTQPSKKRVRDGRSCRRTVIKEGSSYGRENRQWGKRVISLQLFF